MPVVLAEAGLHLVDMRVVGVDLTLRVGNLPVIGPTCLSDLVESLSFAAPVIGLGSAEFPPGLVVSSFVTLLAAEHSLEHSRRLGLEVSPPWRRDRNCTLAQF
jgi:hypothetical protein